MFIFSMFRVILPPRQDSDVYKVYGVFKDSKVIRGPHWHYTSRDGRFTPLLGAQWLSGRVLDPRPRGGGFEPHRRHCVVVLEQHTFILA